MYHIPHLHLPFSFWPTVSPSTFILPPSHPNTLLLHVFPSSHLALPLATLPMSVNIPVTQVCCFLKLFMFSSIMLFIKSIYKITFPLSAYFYIFLPIYLLLVLLAAPLSWVSLQYNHSDRTGLQPKKKKRRAHHTVERAHMGVKVK